jgi:hypothetical protein
LGFHTGYLVVTEARPVATPAREQLVPDVPLSGWLPHVIARRKLGGRGVNPIALWGSLALVLSLLVLLVAGREPADSGVRLSDATQTLLAALDETRANALSGPEVWSVAEATTGLLHLESAARQLFDMAGQLDNRDLLLREETASIAADALDLGRLIGDDWTYRLAVRPVLDKPELPLAGDPVELAELLASWQILITDSVSKVAPPSHYSEHFTEVQRHLAGFDRWRISYLDAIASGDFAGASARVEQLETAISQLENDLSSAQLALRTDTLSRLERIEQRATVLDQ